VSFSGLLFIRRRKVVHRVSSSLLGPVDPSFRALSGRLKFMVRRHKFNKYSLFFDIQHQCAGMSMQYISQYSLGLPAGTRETRRGRQNSCVLALSVVVTWLPFHGRRGTPLIRNRVPSRGTSLIRTHSPQGRARRGAGVPAGAAAPQGHQRLRSVLRRSAPTQVQNNVSFVPGRYLYKEGGLHFPFSFVSWRG